MAARPPPAVCVASPVSPAMRGAPLYETFPVIKVEPRPTTPEIRMRKRRRRKHVKRRSRSPSQKEIKRRRRTRKVKKLVLVSNGNGMWEVKHNRHSRRAKNRKPLLDYVNEIPCDKSDHPPKNVESATGEWCHYNQRNGDILLGEEVEAAISPRPTGMQVRNSLSNVDVYERLQPENIYISTSDCSLTNNTESHIPTRPDDGEADPDVIIVEEADNTDPEVIIVEDGDKDDPEVIIVEEVTKQTLDNDSCAGLESALVTNVSSPSDVRTEFVDMDYSRELVPLPVPERVPETYVGDSDTRGVIQQKERQQWNQPQLRPDHWEQQLIRLSPTEADYTVYNDTLSEIPLLQGQQFQRQPLVQDVEIDHIQFPRSSPLPYEQAPSKGYRWHQPQAFPEQSQNDNHPRGCQCGSVHETAGDKLAVTADKYNMLQGSRLILCEEQVEKETRIENASQFLKTFHGVHSDCEESTPREAVFQEQETPYRQHGQYPKTRQDFSEEYQFQQSYRTVKTEEYQFVKTIFKNSIPSQRYITAQAVAVDRQVIYKEEYKIIPQPQLEWNFSDGCTVSDVNLDLNLSRGTLVDVSP